MADSDIVRLTQGQIKMIGDKIKEAGGAITLTQSDADFEYTFGGITRTGIAVALLKPGSYIVDNAYLFFGYNTTVLMNDGSTTGKLYTYAPFSGTIQIYGAEGAETDIYTLYHPKRYALIETGGSDYCSLGYTLSNGTAKTYDMTNKSGFLKLPLGEVRYESIERFPLVYPPRYSAGLVIDFDPATFVLATDSAVTSAVSEARQVMVGATSINNGQAGRVPQPLIADREKFLRGDGTWVSSQSDYDENDNTASSYIQNRPFYEFERIVEERHQPSYVSWTTTNSLDNFADAQIVKEYAVANNIPTYGHAVFSADATGGTGTIQTGFPELGTLATSGDEFYWDFPWAISDTDGTEYRLEDFNETSFEDFVSTTTGNTYRISSSTFSCNSSTGTLICLYRGDEDKCVFYLTLTSPSYLFMSESFFPNIIVRTTQAETKLLDSKFLNIDGQTIINDDGVLKSVSSGGITTLITDDYNYHQTGDTNDGIAIWLLTPGYYQIGETLKLYMSTNTYYGVTEGYSFIVFKADLSGNTGVVAINPNIRSDLNCNVVNSQGQDLGIHRFTSGRILVESDLIDNLTSSSVQRPLTAKQGYVLNNKITALEAYSVSEFNNIVEKA